MASSHPDVVFVDVPVTPKTAAIHQGLDVTSLPFGHLYHPVAGLVEESKLTRRHVPSFEMKLDCYLHGSCDLGLRGSWAAVPELAPARGNDPAATAAKATPAYVWALPSNGVSSADAASL
jgi:hypothetical protein